jgi:hypothetical protein
VTPCAVCTVHKETRSASFLIEPQNHCLWVFRFGSQNRQLRFGELSLKITAMVSWFVSQNQADFSLSVASQNRHEEVGLRFPSVASRLVDPRLYVVYVALSWRSRGVEAEDGRINATGYIGLFYL